MKYLKIYLILFIAFFITCKSKKPLSGEYDKLLSSSEKAFLSINQGTYNKLVEDLKSKNYSKIYENMTDLCKKVQDEDDLKMILEFQNHLYGDLNTYTIGYYSVKSQFGFDKPMASVIYDVDYSKCSGKIYAAFEVENKDTIKIQSVRFVIKDSTQFPFIDSLTSPFFKDLKEKNYPDIYNNLASERFKAYTPIIKFEAYINDVNAIKVDTLLNSQVIGLSEKHLVLYLAYQTDTAKRKLNLTYVKYGNDFLIEGINLN